MMTTKTIKKMQISYYKRDTVTNDKLFNETHASTCLITYPHQVK